MRISERTVCDICGEVILPHNNKYKIKYDRSFPYIDSPIYEYNCKVDMCEKCFKEMASYIRRKRIKND